MPNFNHIRVQYDFDVLKQVNEDGKRYYATGDNHQFPSVTSVLSILSRDSIRAWRARVGADEANRVSRFASSRGTLVHSMVEKYLKNETEFLTEHPLRGTLPDTHALRDIALVGFNSLKPILDERLNNIHALEKTLYSVHLGLAGTVDCIAEFDGVLSVIDFKTSNKPKNQNHIHNYFMQESAYAIMFEERTGIPVSQLVTLIAVDSNQPQVFIEKRDRWAPQLLETIELYWREKDANLSFP